MKKTASEELVYLIKGATPSIVFMLFAFCIVFCVIQRIDIPEWFKIILGTGTGGGIIGYAVRKKSS